MNCRHGDYAWLGVFAVIIGYEIVAREGELLSESADRFMQTHPWITRIAVAITAAHLTNLVPGRYDPWLLILHGCGAVRRRLFPARKVGSFTW